MAIVSIIIPIYNVSEYIERCITSVMHQTYGDIECIIVDDCTPDDSMEKCQRLLDSYSGPIEFKIIHHERNRGLSAARNSGLDHAKGTYIHFIDSDDYIDSNLYEKMLPELGKGYDMVSFGYIREKANGEVLHLKNFEQETIKHISVNEKYRYIYTQILRYYYGWEAWGRLFRREIIERFNLRFEDNNKIFAEDVYFIVCFSLISSSHRYVNESLYHFVERSNSIQGVFGVQSNISRLAHLCNAIDRYIDYLTINYNFPAGKSIVPILYFSIIEHEALNRLNDINAVLMCNNPERQMISDYLNRIHGNFAIMKLLGRREFFRVETVVYRLIGRRHVWDWFYYLFCQSMNRVLLSYHFLKKRLRGYRR